LGNSAARNQARHCLQSEALAALSNVSACVSGSLIKQDNADFDGLDMVLIDNFLA
jgi:hypothetical protein